MGHTYTYALIPGGYHVTCSDGTINERQAFKPGVPGRVPMTEAEAIAAAEAFIAELEASSAQ